eukprot:2204792-Pleurochrysis_carterae.AAC.1
MPPSRSEVRSSHCVAAQLSHLLQHLVHPLRQRSNQRRLLIHTSLQAVDLCRVYTDCVGAGVEVDELGLIHAAIAGAKPVLLAAVALGPDGRNNATRSLRGTYSSESLLGAHMPGAVALPA